LAWPVLVGKGKTMTLAASVSGLLGFTFTEVLTSQWGLAAISTIVASIGGAAFVAFPKIITARADARARDSAARETETTNLIERMTTFHGAEIQFYQRRVAEKELIATLERKSKHKALSECQRCVFQINLLESMLRANNVVPPEFVVTPYQALVGDEDRQIEGLAAARVAESSVIYSTVQE
jgi:hypothetical protein